MPGVRQYRQRHLPGRLKSNALHHNPQQLKNAVHVGCAGLALRTQGLWLKHAVCLVVCPYTSPLPQLYALDMCVLHTLGLH